MALKGMEPAPNSQRRGGSKRLEGGSFKFWTHWRIRHTEAGKGICGCMRRPF